MRPIGSRLAAVCFRCAILVLALGPAGCMHSPGVTTHPEPPLYSWVELTPKGASVRVIVPPATGCPTLSVDEHPLAMAKRADPASGFNVRACEALLPQGAVSAYLGNQKLPVFPKKLQKVVVLGDTGCRAKSQSCNDPDKWPFADVARKAAEHTPDLVITVGDYIYREKEWGDTWKTWEADFFKPAAPLLAAAPWVIVRGNHEACARGDKGWFRFLAHGPAADGCDQDAPSPWAVRLPKLQLIVLNTSGNGPQVDYVKSYQEIDKLATETDTDSWLLMHHPLWAFVPGPQPITAEQQKGSGNKLNQSIKLVLSGHVHLFEALGFQGEIPSSVVIGTGGTSLDPEIQDNLTQKSVIVEGQAICPQVSCTSRQFGFAEMAPSKKGWDLTFFRKDGVQEACLQLEERILRHMSCPEGNPATAAYCFSKP